MELEKRAGVETLSGGMRAQMGTLSFVPQDRPFVRVTEVGDDVA
jgi:hypothetical protein